MRRTRILNLLLPLLGLLFSLTAGSLSAQSEEDFLEPDEAFRPTASSEGPDAILVKWNIAEGYYLYRSKFKFSSDGRNGTLGDPQYPAAKVKHDDFFGDVEVYRNQVEIRIPVKRGAGVGETLRLETVSQGCADAGLCYPPQTRSVQVELAMAEPAAKPTGLRALGALGQQLGLGEEEEILPPEEAYEFMASVERGDKLQLLWKIADGTYLYQDKIRFKLLSGDGVALGEYELPKPKIKKNAIRPDGTTGDLPVYVKELDIQVPLIRGDTKATEIELLVAYQGCADTGVCYPPQKQQVALALPVISEAATATPDALEQARSRVMATQALASEPAEQTMVSEQDQIAATLAGGNAWLIVLTFFGLGLLLALTPCVFPMIPILSGIIAGQGDKITTGHAFLLSLIYVLAMAATYTIAGVLAGLFGQNLQAAFQNPWVLAVFATIFVLLALSMFGFYELQLPSKWQSKLSEASNHQKGGSYTGVAIMGFLSALIVGPCVAPPLAGALIYIGQTGDALLGGIGLFALAMGMGSPLLVIGASAGKLLPRAGSWMDTIKAVFGVGMLAVAIILLERILPPAVSMLLWGSLLIVSSVYMGALKQLPVEASGWDWLWKGLGCVLMIYGALMLVGAAAGGKDTVQPLRGLGFSVGASAEADELHFKRIKTLADLEREVAAASKAGQPVMLDFYADWCVSCKEMERYTFSDPKVIRTLSDFLLLQADVTADDAEDRALLQEHFGLPGPPAIIFYGRDGKERRNYRVVGYMEAGRFNSHIQQAIR